MMSRPARSGVLFVLPTIDDEADEATKNALAIRNACSVEGKCPSCGAEPELYLNRELEGVFHLVFWHEDDCPATTDEAA